MIIRTSHPTSLETTLIPSPSALLPLSAPEFSLLYDNHTIIIENGLQAMRDGNDRTVQLLDHFLHYLVCVVVDRGVSFVDQQDLWMTEQCACDAEELTLAGEKRESGAGSYGA